MLFKETKLIHYHYGLSPVQHLPLMCIMSHIIQHLFFMTVTLWNHTIAFESEFILIGTLVSMFWSTETMTCTTIMSAVKLQLKWEYSSSGVHPFNSDDSPEITHNSTASHPSHGPLFSSKLSQTIPSLFLAMWWRTVGSCSNMTNLLFTHGLDFFVTLTHK